MALDIASFWMQNGNGSGYGNSFFQAQIFLSKSPFKNKMLYLLLVGNDELVVIVCYLLRVMLYNRLLYDYYTI